MKPPLPVLLVADALVHSRLLVRVLLAGDDDRVDVLVRRLLGRRVVHGHRALGEAATGEGRYFSANVARTTIVIDEQRSYIFWLPTVRVF